MDKWENIGGLAKHYYNIKYAESIDGIHWVRQNIVAIDYQNSDEYAFGRPFVCKEDNIYKMWYSYREISTRLDTPESLNGINWNRKDEESGIKISAEGWDSEMIEYPHIFECMGNKYMLYNGNGYGKSGIGIAIYE